MNVRIKIKGKIVKVLCLVLVLGLCFSEGRGQNTIYKLFQESEWVKYHDSLHSIYSSHKTFVKEFELQALIALSYYPELKNVPITFKYRDIKTTMEVRPEYLSAIRSHNRKYIIFIDTNTHNEGVLLKEISFNAQIGVIGHELAHIIDFEHRSVGSLLMLALNYAVLQNHANYEKSIDEMTIKRGLGWQSLDFADFMQNKSKASVRYKKFKQLNYLSTMDIENEIARMKIYSAIKSPNSGFDSSLETQ